MPLHPAAPERGPHRALHTSPRGWVAGSSPGRSALHLVAGEARWRAVRPGARRGPKTGPRRRPARTAAPPLLRPTWQSAAHAATFPRWRKAHQGNPPMAKHRSLNGWRNPGSHSGLTHLWAPWQAIPGRHSGLTSLWRLGWHSGPGIAVGTRTCSAGPAFWPCGPQGRLYCPWGPQGQYVLSLTHTGHCSPAPQIPGLPGDTEAHPVGLPGGPAGAAADPRPPRPGRRSGLVAHRVSSIGRVCHTASSVLAVGHTGPERNWRRARSVTTLLCLWHRGPQSHPPAFRRLGVVAL